MVPLGTFEGSVTRPGYVIEHQRGGGAPQKALEGALLALSRILYLNKSHLTLAGKESVVNGGLPSVDSPLETDTGLLGPLTLVSPGDIPPYTP